MSLKKVPDLETSFLMKEFYKNLFIEKQDKYNALKNAKIKLIEKGYDKLSWGSFVIYG